MLLHHAQPSVSFFSFFLTNWIWFVGYYPRPDPTQAGCIAVSRFVSRYSNNRDTAIHFCIGVIRTDTPTSRIAQLMNRIVSHDTRCVLRDIEICVNITHARVHVFELLIRRLSIYTVFSSLSLDELQHARLANDTSLRYNRIKKRCII